MTAPHPARRGIRTTIAGIIINALLALLKGVAGYLGNCYALVADAIESFTDVFTSLAVLGGLRIASRPRDEDHPYGHGKAEPIAAIIVSLALVGAAVIIIVQSVHEILTPHHAPAPFTLIVLVAVVLVKETLFRFVLKVGERTGSTAVKADAWHHRSDAITSAAAFIGITVALAGGEGYESADDWAALCASAIILYNARRLFLPAFHELMDAAPPRHIEEEVRKAAGTVKGVTALEKCLVRKMGFDYYIDLHVIVNGSLSVKEGHDIGHRVKDAIRAAVPGVADVMVHVEPDE